MHEIDGRTRTCGLIGNPVEHTLSPMIHNTLANRKGHKLVYVPFLVEAQGLEAAVRGAHALNILGMNVTVPYKSAVIPYLQELDALARDIGAVNTLVRTETGYKGYNTDMTGLYRAMMSEHIRIEGEDIILLGAGGAARAVAFLCAHYKAGTVYLLNRTIEKAEQVAQEVNTAAGRSCIMPMTLSEHGRIPKGKYLAVQCTSVGLYPDTEAAVIEDASFYELVHTGYDLIYRPAETKFMSLVEKAGGKAYHGLKMLLYQGVNAYELWNDVTVSEEEAMYIYEQMKKELGIEE